MGNVLLILKRDIRRILRTPIAWLVVIFLCILPSLYTWFNLAAFWNPYDNTGNIEICVTNEDTGASNDLVGDLVVGDMIVDQMKQVDQLKWVFVDRDEALEEVKSGRAYAALIIPETFSADIVDLLSGDLEGPKIEYYVNEKVGPIGPKITDTATNLLDTKINDTFVSVASGVIADAANKAGVELKTDLDKARSELTSTVAKAKTSLASVRDSFGKLSSEAADASAKVKDLQQRMGGLTGDIERASAALDRISAGIGSINADLAFITASLGSALDDGAAKMMSTLTRTNTVLAELGGKVSTAVGVVDKGIAYGEAAVQRGNEVAAELERIIGLLPEGQVKQDATAVLQELNGRLAEQQAELDQMSALTSSIQTAVDSINGLSGQLSTSLQSAIDIANAERTNIALNTAPALSSLLGDLSSQMSALGSTIGKQTVLVGQTQTLLGNLATTLDTVAGTLGDTGSMIDALLSNLDSVSVDASSLSASSLLNGLFGDGALDAGKVADFMGSPTMIESEVLYPLSNYGSAMAPLFINLTLWVGVFMLMVIFRLETDDKDIPGLTATQRYFGRLLLLAPIACMQAIVCCAGCMIMGVQTAGIVAFFITAVIASLAYLAIQYTLSTTFQLIGMGLCIVLVFVQIPGASGLYPVEMTTPFFQEVYPLFPFSYGIDAIRETIGGFYGFTWLRCIGMLFLFLAIFLAIGVAVRPFLANVNRMFARQLKESELINVESTQLPSRRYRLSQIVQSVVDGDRFRQAVEDSQHRFESLYPKLKLFGLGGAIAITVVVALAMTFAGADKVAVLTFWLLWFIAVAVYFIIVEGLRDSIAHRRSLRSLSDDEAYELYETRGTLSPVNANVGDDAGSAVIWDYGAGTDDAAPLEDPGVFREEEDADEAGDGR